MNPKIVRFNPIKSNGNILGFCSLQVMVHLNGKLIPMLLKAKVARNGQTGHVFVSIHQETYQKPDGTTGYSNLANFSPDSFKEFNESTSEAWKEFNASNGGVPNEQTLSQVGIQVANQSQPTYPHGMARNTDGTQQNVNQTQAPKQTRQYKELDEEIPF